MTLLDICFKKADLEKLKFAGNWYIYHFPFIKLFLDFVHNFCYFLVIKLLYNFNLMNTYSVT